MLFQLKDLEISRYVTPGIIGNEVELVCSVDGSELLSAARVFVRYPTGENTYNCQYLFGSILLIGQGDESSVKCECHAMFIGTKLIALADKILTNYRITQYHIVSDSEITLSGICSLSANQRLYYRQRNGFSRTQVEKFGIILHHCPGELSDSDIFTKIRKESLH